MEDDILKECTGNLTEEEKRASDAIYSNYLSGTGAYSGHGAMSDEQIIENIFHGNPKRVQERIKEVEDIHVKQMPGGKWQMSRYSEERSAAEKEDFEELKRQNAELKKDFEELKNLIIEKLS